MTAIYCFSGTGNSLFVARRLAQALDAQVIAIGPDAPLPDADNVVWIFPVYAWGVAPVMRRFIETVSAPDSWHTARHHMVATCGDDIGLTHRQWRRLMRKRRWPDYGTYSVTMPNTYVLFPGFNVDPHPVAQQKLITAEERTNAVARMIVSGFSSDDVAEGRAAWLKSAVVHPLFVRFAMDPAPFHATDACISCGKCAADCPLHNITISQDRPQWKNNCAMCLRCYHGCPTHAVAYGGITRGKGQYKGPVKD